MTIANDLFGDTSIQLSQMLKFYLTERENFSPGDSHFVKKKYIIPSKASMVRGQGFYNLFFNQAQEIDLTFNYL